MLELKGSTRLTYPVNDFVPHAFDIDCHGSSLKVWLGIEQRNSNVDHRNNPRQCLKLEGSMQLDELAVSSFKPSMPIFTVGPTMGLITSAKNEIPGAQNQSDKHTPRYSCPAPLPDVTVRPFDPIDFGKSKSKCQSDDQAPLYLHYDERRAQVERPFNHSTDKRVVAPIEAGEQSSLLQVFETELAGRSNKAANLDERFSTSGASANPTFTQSQHILELPGSSTDKARSSPSTYSGIPKPPTYLLPYPSVSSAGSGVDAYPFRQYATSGEPMFEPSGVFKPVKAYSGSYDLLPPSPYLNTHRHVTSGEKPPAYTEELYASAQEANKKQTVPVFMETGTTHKPQSVEESSDKSDLTPAATRFPTLQQFEGRSSADLSARQSLPSMEPLFSMRSCAQAPSPRRYEAYKKILYPSMPTEPMISNDTLPLPARLPKIPDANESSGDFFKRMTGVDLAANKRSPFETLPNNSRHLFDGFSQDFREREGPECHATAPGSGTPCLANCRQSYPENFSRNIAFPMGNPLSHDWSDSNIESSHRDSARIKYQPRSSGTGNMVLSHGPSHGLSPRGIIAAASGEAFAGKERPTMSEKVQACVQKLQDLDFSGNGVYDNGLLFYAQAAEGNLSNAIDMLEGVQHVASPAPTPANALDMASGEVFAGEHSDPTTVANVQACVEKLQDLGFGRTDKDGNERLVVYAQAADGNLSDAIDMIDEDERAYSEL